MAMMYNGRLVFTRESAGLMIRSRPRDAESRRVAGSRENMAARGITV
jgi:hypothetical protein